MTVIRRSITITIATGVMIFLVLCIVSMSTATATYSDTLPNILSDIETAVDIATTVIVKTGSNSNSSDLDDDSSGGGGNIGDMEDMSVPQWVSDGGFILLILIVYASMWASALVCEDYFVPAMGKLCQRFDVSDDMAGATLMAIGNSAPQLFISLVSIFITKSSLGLGTAIGTVLFNHLCVCGVCVLNVRDGAIPLDWRTLWRDCVFYLLSLIMLVSESELYYLCYI
jgi:hypothetical protein